MSDCVVDLVSANRDGWDDWFDDTVSAERSRARAGRSGLHVLAVGIAETDAPALLQEMAEAGYRSDMGGVVVWLGGKPFLISTPVECWASSWSASTPQDGTRGPASAGSSTMFGKRRVFSRGGGG